MAKNEYFNYIHILRGFASLLVVWSHLVGWWLLSNNTSSDIQIYWEKMIVQPFHLYHNGGHLGVLIFFLISGYIVTHVSLNETVRNFALKRIFRIFPALLIALIITYLITIISLRIGLNMPLGTQSIELIDYIYNFLLLNFIIDTPYVDSVTWTLVIEMMFYILTATLLASSKKDPLKSTWYFMLIMIFVMMLYWVHPIVSNIANHGVFVFFLLIGRIIYLGNSKLITLSQSIVLGSTCFFVFVLFIDLFNDYTLFSGQMGTMPSYIWAILIFFIAKMFLNKKYKITSFLGDISYSLYLIHVPVGSIVLNFLYREEVPFKYALIVAFSSCLLVSYLIYKFVEIPSQKMVRKFLN